MIDKQKLLDEVMRREKTRVVKRVLKYGAFILFFGAIYSYAEFKNFDRVKFSKEMGGVISAIQTPNNNDLQSSLTTYVVKLRNDKTVKIPQEYHSQIEKGEIVNILQEELESGRLQYSIILSLPEQGS